MDKLGIVKVASEFQAANKQYQNLIASLDCDKAGQLAAEKYLRSSTAVYKGDIIRFGYYPKVYPASAMDYLGEIAQQIYSLCEHAIDLFCTNVQYRAAFQLDELTEQLCLTNCHYKTTIPIMRADLFLNEDNFGYTLCEINTDGTSAMNEEREMACALEHTESYKLAQSQIGVRPQELFDSWVHTFEQIYADFSAQTGGAATPTIAIVDFLDNTSHTELDYFQQRFTALGHNCILADVRDLVWQNGELTANGVEIEAIYRRATTGVLLSSLESKIMSGHSCHCEETKLACPALDAGKQSINNYTGVSALIAASQSDKVALIGSWQTQIVHVKQFFAVLHQVLGQGILSDSEEDFVRRHVPFTGYLTGDFVQSNSVLQDKDTWIIKPLDDYGSGGVYAGKDFSDLDWTALVKQHTAEDSAATYIAQVYAPQYATPNIVLGGGPSQELVDKYGHAKADEISHTPPAPKPAQEAMYNNLTGLFIYGGKLAGVFGRANSLDQGLIVGFAGGMSVPSLIVSEPA